MSQDYYVYTHSLPEQPPFYVGKGTKKRTQKIAREYNKHHSRIVNKYGKENIIVRTMLCRSEAHAFALEVKLIAALRNGGAKLANQTDGGEGTSNPSLETRMKLSAHSKQRMRDPERLAKLIAAAQTPESRAKRAKSKAGKKTSPETRAKIRAAHNSPERRAKTIEALTGRLCTPETRAKMSDAHKGRVVSPETRAKISASHQGLTRSPEHRKNISAARTGLKQSPEHTARAVAGKKAAKLLKEKLMSSD